MNVKINFFSSVFFALEPKHIKASLERSTNDTFMICPTKSRPLLDPGERVKNFAVNFTRNSSSSLEGRAAKQHSRGERKREKLVCWNEFMQISCIGMENYQQFAAARCCT